MFCTKCGAPIKEGAKFCVKCGSPVAASVAASVKAQSVETTNEQIPVKKKKKHTGLKVLLAIFIIIILIAAAAVACWYFVVPEGTKSYIFLQKNLMDKDYKAAADRFCFTNEKLDKDKDKFSEYAEENFTSGCELMDLVRANYTLKTQIGDVTLTYDDSKGRFTADPFTYTYTVMEPVIALGTPESTDDLYTEVVCTGLNYGEVTYEYNSVMGDSAKTNNVEVTMSLKDGTIDEIIDITAEDDSVAPEEYAEIKDGKLYFNKLLVSEEYTEEILNNYCKFMSEVSENVKAGTSPYSFASKYDSIVVTDNYYDEYVNMMSVADEFNSMRYSLELECIDIKPVGVFDVESTCFIIEAECNCTTSFYGESMDSTQSTYILVRPYDDYERVVYNSVNKEDMEYYNDCLDSGMDYKDALAELFSYAGYNMDDFDYSQFAVPEVKFALTDGIEKRYITELSNYIAHYEYEDARFNLLDIGTEYPLMICMPGVDEEDQTEAFIYDESSHKINDLGPFNGNGQFMYIPGTNIIYTSGNNDEYYYEMMFEIRNGYCECIGNFSKVESDDETMYMVDGVSVTQKEYTSKLNNMYNAYPFEYLEYVYYEDCYETDEDTVKDVFAKCRE